MKFTHIYHRPSWMRACALILCGFIIGFIAVTLWTKQHVQHLQDELAETLQNQQKKSENKPPLERRMGARKWIEHVVVRWDTLQPDMASPVKRMLVAQIEQLYEGIVYQPVQAVSVYRALGDHHTVSDVLGIDYRIHVTFMSVLDTTLSVYIVAQPLAHGTSDGR
jgi:hypothetical protein